MRYLFLSMRYASLLAFLFMTSCDDDETVKDTTNPVITITSPAPDGMVKGSVLVKATVVETDLKLVEVFVDGVSIGTSTSTSIDLPWNTKLVQDGIHTIKVVATDNGNNSSEATVSVEVLNTLLRITIPANAMTDMEDVWFFISDKQGNVFGVKQAQKGQTLVFETPESYEKGQTIEIHRLFVDKILRQYVIHSFSDVAPRSFTFDDYYVAPPPAATVGTYQANITNIPFSGTWPQAIGEGVNGWSTSGSEGNYVLNVNLAMQSTSVTLSVRESSNIHDVPHFAHLTDVTAGGSIELDYNQMAEMDVHNVNLGGDFTYATADISALPEAGNYGKSYFMDHFQGDFSQETINTLTIFTPGDVYPEYLTNMFASGGGIARSYFKIGAIPSSFKPLNATVSSFGGSGRTLNLVTTGSYDVAFVNANAHKEIEGAGHYFFWTYVTGGGSTHALTVPVLPSEVLEEHPQLSEFQVKTFRTITLADYVGINGYQDYVDFEFSTGIPYTEKYQEALSVHYSLEEGFDINGRKRSNLTDGKFAELYLPKFPRQMK